MDQPSMNNLRALPASAVPWLFFIMSKIPFSTPPQKKIYKNLKKFKKFKKI